MNRHGAKILTLLFSSIIIFASTFAEAASWTGRASYYRAHTRLGCAHRFLPFGTPIQVTNLRNGRHLILTVNDRGPFIRGRIIDVSIYAADLLGFRHAGVVPVRIETMARTAAAKTWGMASAQSWEMVSANTGGTTAAAPPQVQRLSITPAFGRP